MWNKILEYIENNSIPEPNSGCWLWLGNITETGYCSASGIKGFGSAYRAALCAKVGRKLASKELACHTCDNPSCCNPDHLYVGNHLTNSRDMINRKRHPSQSVEAKHRRDFERRMYQKDDNVRKIPTTALFNKIYKQAVKW